MKNRNWDQLLSPRFVAIMLAMVVTLWAINLIVIKYLTNYFPPIALSGIRLTIASSLLVPITFRRHGLVKLPLHDWLPIIGVGFFSIFLHQITLSWGVSVTSATHSVLIIGLIPLFTMLLASWFIHEPLSLNKITSVFLGLSGVFLIINPATDSNASSIIGDSVILLSALAYVVGSLFAKKSTASTPLLILTTYSHLIASIGLLILGVGVNQVWVYPGAFEIWPLALLFFSGLICTAVGALCWNTGIKIIGASKAALFLNGHPIIGLFASALFLGEHLAWQHYASLALIVLGITLGTGNFTRFNNPQPTEP